MIDIVTDPCFSNYYFIKCLITPTEARYNYCGDRFRETISFDLHNVVTLQTRKTVLLP